MYLSPAGQKRLQSMEEVERMKDEGGESKISNCANKSAEAEKKQKEYEKMQRQFNFERDKEPASQRGERTGCQTH
jgi:hypothetical protein